jgi:hypothetical protein
MRDDPFRFSNNWWDDVMSDLDALGVQLPDQGSMEGHLSDYVTALGGPGIVETPFNAADGQGGLTPGVHPGGAGVVDGGMGRPDDGLYHANFGDSSNAGSGNDDRQYQDGNSGVGPVIGGMDGGGGSGPADSTSHLLGDHHHSSLSHHQSHQHSHHHSHGHGHHGHHGFSAFDGGGGGGFSFSFM